MCKGITYFCYYILSPPPKNLKPYIYTLISITGAIFIGLMLIIIKKVGMLMKNRKKGEGFLIILEN